MDNILKFLNNHSSIRQFTSDNISREDELKIVTTAQRSPTSSNLQAYSILGIRNKKIKETLSKLSGNQQHVLDCPLFLVFCADLYRLKTINDKKGYPFNGEYIESLIIAVVDASLAASKALMAAQALNMGGVMVGGIRNNLKDVSRLLKLPDLVFPVMGMSLGYPAATPKLKPRLPLEGIYHEETYNDTNYPQAIAEYDKTIDGLNYLKSRQYESENYPDFDGLYSWSEHTARRMATENITSNRAYLKSYLEEIGFSLK